jgi:hypothetical protein
MWAEPEGSGDLVWRTLGVLSILLAAVTVMTPVFHKLSSRDNAESIDLQIERLRDQITALEKQKAELSDN